MENALLELRDVDTYYGTMPVLRRASISVAVDEVVFVLGVNGAGKSTLLKTISGLVRPARGEVLFRGQVISGLAIESLMRLGICHVPEGRHLFGSMTVMENLEMGAYVRGGLTAEVLKDMDMIFSYFPRLLERKKQLARQLSGGEQQMLAIARGLMSRPSLLLLDEPSLGLSPIMVEELANLIVELRARLRCSVLLVEQDVPLAFDVCSRGYVLQSGEVVASGSKEELASGALLTKLFLGRESAETADEPIPAMSGNPQQSTT